MPAVIAFLVNAFRVIFASQLGRWIVSALVFMGISYGTQKVLIAPAISQLTTMMNGGPAGSFGAAALNWMGVLRFDQAVSMLAAAVTTKMGVQNARMMLTKRA